MDSIRHPLNPLDVKARGSMDTLRGRFVAFLPNLFTLSSVFCGFYSLTFSTRGGAADSDFFYAALAICLAFFFDTFDGRIARMTRTQSELGLQLDSLADVVSFGVAPAMLVYKWALSGLGPVSVFVCGLFAACAAFRLARFNVLTAHHTEPDKYIIGLPVPVAASVIVSLVLAVRTLGSTGPVVQLAILGLVAVLAGMMVSRIRFRSFKGTRINRQSIAVLTLVVSGSLAIAARLSWSYVLLFLVSAYLTLGLAESLALVTRSTLEARRVRRHAARMPLADTDSDPGAEDLETALDELALAPVAVQSSSEARRR
jgi:CDP-diacylglycerol--serine O-phosphatidyltransferase